MCPEDQLKTLLDKLDLVASMRTSGGRTKRMRLLRREINSLRHKISHQDRNSRLLNGKMKGDKSKEGKSEEKMDYITSNTGNFNFRYFRYRYFFMSKLFVINIFELFQLTLKKKF